MDEAPTGQGSFVVPPDPTVSCDSTASSDSQRPKPAFYAARGGGWRDWWTLLHPPYTAWHLSYVVIGACLAPTVSISVLVGSLVAFFLAVGVAAHALDELNGRPLRSGIASAWLGTAAAVSLAGAVVVGAVGVSRVGWWLVVFMAAGVALVVAYNLELIGGRLHNDAVFALAWGAFPVLTGYFAQAHHLGLVSLVAAGAAFSYSQAQRALSTPARELRRRVSSVEGRMIDANGAERLINRSVMLAPLEAALAWMSWAIMAVALSLALYRLG
ncbi:MAG: hypothetical protein ACYCS7_15960 [Acidimicrobiales bacterium]